MVFAYLRGNSLLAKNKFKLIALLVQLYLAMEVQMGVTKNLYYW